MLVGLLSGSGTSYDGGRGGGVGGGGGGVGAGGGGGAHEPGFTKKPGSNGAPGWAGTFAPAAPYPGFGGCALKPASPLLLKPGGIGGRPETGIGTPEGS